MPSISDTPFSRRRFNQMALLASRLLFPNSAAIISGAATPSSTIKKRAIIDAVKLVAGKGHYDFQFDSISLTYRANFQRYFRGGDISRLDEDAFEVITDVSPLEDHIPGFVTSDENGIFNQQLSFFNPWHTSSLSFREMEEIRRSNVTFLGEILKEGGMQLHQNNVLTIYERTGDALYGISQDRSALAEMATSKSCPDFAGKTVLDRTLKEGPDFLKNNLWFRLHRRKAELSQRLKSGQDQRLIEEELADTNSSIDKMNGIKSSNKRSKHIHKNTCTALSIISPIRNLSLDIEEKCKSENIELILIKRKDDIIGFIYSNSKGIIEFIKPETLKETAWRENDDRMVISFEKGDKAALIENKIKDLYC